MLNGSFQIANAVLVAKHLGATLVLPEIIGNQGEKRLVATDNAKLCPPKCVYFEETTLHQHERLVLDTFPNSWFNV